MAMNDATLISRAMALLGARTSKAKAAASRRNGKRGGRPLGRKDSAPRRRRKVNDQ
jgi:hypothetical protein